MIILGKELRPIQSSFRRRLGGIAYRPVSQILGTGTAYQSRLHLDPYEQDLRNYIRSHHPDAVLEVDGKPVPVDDVPLQYVREYRKSRNPNLVFEVNGKSVAELWDILNRHDQEFAGIEGCAGWGIDKDGIFVRVDEPHGIFPTELEGAAVHLKPAPLIGCDFQCSL